jgi:acyl carrier protein
LSVGESILAYLAESGAAHRPDLDLRTELIEEEVLDSLGIFSLIEFLEERFGVSIEAEDVTIDNFRTVEKIETLVERRRVRT